MKKNKSGFTMIEVMIASVITFIMLSGVLTSFIASMKASRAQNLHVIAENLANEIIKNEVRNRPFKGDASTALCGDENDTTSIVYQLEKQLVNINTFWEYPLDLTKYPTLKTLSKGATVTLEIRPIPSVVDTSNKAIFSDSRVKVKSIVTWKLHEGDATSNKIEISTICSDGGIFDPTATIMTK